jgi:hypothetical protein
MISFTPSHGKEYQLPRKKAFLQNFYGFPASRHTSVSSHLSGIARAIFSSSVRKRARKAWRRHFFSRRGCTAGVCLSCDLKNVARTVAEKRDETQENQNVFAKK